MRKTVALLASMAAVVVLANMVALATIPNTARAAFPGKNGDIIYSDNTCPPAGGRCSFPIIRMNGDGSGKRTLGDFKGTNPDWSADGQKIAFTGYRVPAIYTMNADGSARRRLTDGARGEVSPAWFPDGRKIAFYQYGPNGRPKGAFSENIWAAGLDAQGRPTGRLTRLTSNSADEIDPAISPDGKWIV